MKKWYAFMIMMFLCITSVLPVCAEGNVSRLADDADLLTEAEENTLRDTLNEISTRQKLDVVIVTVNSLSGKTAEAYADDYYDYNGYSADGILFLVSIGEREWHISTKGYGITAFTDAGLDYMEDKFISNLSDGEYNAAFNKYAELCDEFITQANIGKPYDKSNLPKGKFNFGMSLGIAAVSGFVIAFIYCSILKGQLKSVSYQAAAKDYLKKDSLHINTKRDMFLYRKVEKIKKEDDNDGGSSTHTSSSGATHGGSGGSF